MKNAKKIFKKNLGHSRMRKNLFFGLIFIFCSHALSAQQNYVINPSLERYDTCPVYNDNIRDANNWSCIDTTGMYINTSDGEPEYCNVCDTSSLSIIRIPSLSVHNYPRTGKGMALVLMFSDSSLIPSLYQRDYLQGRLYKPLTAGINYSVTFYALLDKCPNTKYAVNRIGAYLDNGEIDTTIYPGLLQTEYTPQILDTNIISDSVNWTKIEGSFTANGTEKFITIGGFYGITQTKHTVCHPSGAGGAYYLVDDISVIESSHLAFAGDDTTIVKGDSIFLGEIALPYTWYLSNSSGLTLIDSTSGGIWVKPNSTTTYYVKQTLNGAVSWDSIKVQVVPSSVNKLQSTMNNIHLYPNPVQNELNISGATNCTIRIFDVVGRMVYHGSTNGEKDIINTRSFANGIYFLQLMDENGEKEIRKFVKE